MQELTASINAKNIIDLEKAASFLGISTATVRNWVKCGHLQTYTNDRRYFFHLSDIENVKNNITNGDLNKLNGRANKSKAERTFIPDEYLQDGVKVDDITKIINFVSENNISISLSLLLLSLNSLQKEKLISDITIQDLIKQKFTFTNKQIGEEITAWLYEVKTNNLKSDYSFLLNCAIPKQRDSLGFLYQSLLAEGKKSQSGSYYTPEIIVNEIIKDYVKTDSKVLDPCCGTGQFLLAFSEVVENPKNIYGVDVDEIAVRIARLNILIKYKDQVFSPNIVCKNTLFEIGNHDLFSLNDENIRNFDVIATNPPWGAHFSKADLVRLKTSFPEITSLESFSYFLKKSIDLLQSGGAISFILPESILNVKTHKDIREIILKNTCIKKVCYLSRVFKNVFTNVIRLDLQKINKNIFENNILIEKENKKHFISQKEFICNDDYVLNIDANNLDRDILQKIYDKGIICLEGNAEWGLGIVTGNNKKHFVYKKEIFNEEIIRGKDIEKFKINNSGIYLKFDPKIFQQVAPEQKYRVQEKIIYRFISKKLIFAIDDKQRLTLNSANFFIPLNKQIPIKVIAALFNSSLYQFYFQKKFNSIKVLRSHIGNMSLPFFTKKENNNIIELVNKIEKENNYFEKLDNYIMERFNLNDGEIKYIKKIIYK
ncbi:MAG: N-6 DNA methylase [bacterium]